MTDIKTSDMIEEIKANFQTGDALKARLVLDQMEKIDTQGQRRLLYELSKGDPGFIVPLLCHLLASFSALAESQPAIREMLISNLIAYPEVLVDCLQNADIKDKTVLIETAGELRLESAIPALLALLGETEDIPTLTVILETLGLIGSPESINVMTDFLYAADREVIMAAIHALGQVGTQTAMHRLSERMGTDNELDLIILGIFAEVQDQVALEKLNDTLRSHHAHMRIYAKEALIRIGVKCVPILLENLKDEDDDLVIHTLNVLGSIGDESAIMPIRKLLNTEPPNANVRFSAYEALAMLPLRKGAYALAAGLTDPEDFVCMAAARAIDRNYNEVLAAGIKNLVRGDSEEARQIVKVIVDAQVDNIFLGLAPEPDFQEMALKYFPRTHPDIRRYYTELLKKHGFDSFATQAAGEGAVLEERKARICAVDDSRMILNVYKTTLHQLGFEPVLFEFPASALKWLEQEKPSLLLTDLNMPEISGIELSKKIREKYSAEELPIIMVTTQSDVQDHEAAKEAGVNAILIKPFNAESLKEAMSRFIQV